MANVLYPKFKQALLDKLHDLNTDTIKVALVTSGYTYNAAHEFVSDLGATRVGTDQTLTTPTIVSGVFDADNPAWTALTGSAVAAIVIYASTGADGTSRLIAFFDTGFTGSPGIPFTPNGGTFNLTFNASGIFAL